MNKWNIKRLTGQVFRWSTRPARTKECGRSMVEMLGVLAIIGVLSAGALKGYSDAMFKYKMNKTIDIYSRILQRLAELDEKGLGVDVGIGWDGDGQQDFVKYGLMDECQEIAIDEDSGDFACHLPVGNISMGFEDNQITHFIFGDFTLLFTSSKECIAFAQAHWENAVPVDWWNPYGFISIESMPIYDPHGVYGDVISKTTMSMITEACQSCDEDGGCRFYHVIRHEL